MSQPAISSAFNAIIEQLVNAYVPKYLGKDAFTRDEIIQHHTPYLISKVLPHVRLVGDGTYVYTQKSSDFEHQKNLTALKKREIL
jgi:hypothetical protein